MTERSPPLTELTPFVSASHCHRYFDKYLSSLLSLGMTTESGFPLM